MNRILKFEIDGGKIQFEEENGESLIVLEPFYEHAWSMITNENISHDKWIIIFNLFGPELAREIIFSFPNVPSRMISQYVQAVGKNDPQFKYMLQLEDQVSQVTHILRERFEVVLKAARLGAPGGKIVVARELGELKSVFGQIPRYCIAGADEVMSIFENHGMH
jgi:hypothetical protein